jgi:hypothetical protein
MERKNGNTERLALEQKEFANSIDEQHKIHINPNKKTVFVKLNQLESGYLSYLKKIHNIPIDYSFIIPLERQKEREEVQSETKEVAFLDAFQNASYEINTLKPVESNLPIIDVGFEPSSFFLLDSLNSIL